MWIDYKVAYKAPYEWHLKDRLLILSIQQLNSSIDAHFKSTGRSLTNQDLNQLLNKVNKKRTGNATIPLLLNAVLSTIYNHRTLSDVNINR